MLVLARPVTLALLETLAQVGALATMQVAVVAEVAAGHFDLYGVVEIVVTIFKMLEMETPGVLVVLLGSRAALVVMGVLVAPEQVLVMQATLVLALQALLVMQVLLVMQALHQLQLVKLSRAVTVVQRVMEVLEVREALEE